VGRLCFTRNRESGWYAIPRHGRGHRFFVEVEIGKRCIPKIAKPRPRYLIASNSDYIANPNGRFNGGERCGDLFQIRITRGCRSLDFIQCCLHSVAMLSRLLNVFGGAQRMWATRTRRCCGKTQVMATFRRPYRIALPLADSRHSTARDAVYNWKLRSTHRLRNCVDGFGFAAPVAKMWPFP
jgi:hypothetical protein